MTLREVINRVEMAAAKCPSVNSIVRNDIFRLNTLQNAKYGVFAWLQGQHRENPQGDLITYSFTLFYADRLLSDKSNELSIQSVGVSTLDNVCALLSEEFEVGEVALTTFNQRFSDECAGVFCTVTITTTRPRCGESFFDGDFNADYSNDFDIEGRTIKVY